MIIMILSRWIQFVGEALFYKVYLDYLAGVAETSLLASLCLLLFLYSKGVAWCVRPTSGHTHYHLVIKIPGMMIYHTVHTHYNIITSGSTDQKIARLRYRTFPNKAYQAAYNSYWNSSKKNKAHFSDLTQTHFINIMKPPPPLNCLKQQDLA